METLQGVSEKRNLEYDSSLIYALSTLRLSLCSLAISPSRWRHRPHSITKWWCWYFDDQFMSGWAGPCVWTHFHWFLLKTGQSFQSEYSAGVPRLVSYQKKKKGGKKSKNREGCSRLRWEREMHQKAFCPYPPHTTATSTRLAVNSTSFFGLLSGRTALGSSCGGGRASV